MVFNFWISFKDIPFGNQEKFAQTFQIQEKIISDLEDTNSTLFRIKQTVDSDAAGYNEKNNGYNNPILYGYAGVSSYTSTLDAKTQDTLQALGLYQKNDRRIAYVDDSRVINLLLNVNYLLTPEVIAHQENISNDPTTNVYKNDEAIGMGFLVPQNFETFKLEKDQPLKNQEMILQQIQQNKDDYFKDTQKISWTKQEDNHYTLTTRTTANGELYLYAPEINWKKVTSFTVNGEKSNPQFILQQINYSILVILKKMLSLP